MASTLVLNSFGYNQLVRKLVKLFGIGWFLAFKITSKLGLNVGSSLFFHDINSLEKIVLFYTTNFFNVESQLRQSIFFFIRRQKIMKNYKGMRHLLHLSVNGQRTHTNCKTQRKLHR